MAHKFLSTALAVTLGLVLACPASGGVFYDIVTDPSGLGADLLAYWRLNETDPSMPAADTTGGTPGTYTGFTAADMGHAGAFPDDADLCVNFDGGQTELIDFGDGLIDGRTQLSGGVWARVDTLDKDHTFLAKGEFGGNQPLLLWRDEAVWGKSDRDTYSVKVKTDGGNDASAYGPDAKATDSDWHFVSFSYQGNTAGGLRLYLDGALIRSADTSGTGGIANNSHPLTAGFPAVPSSDKEMDGRLDDIVLFDRVLSSAEMRRLYLAGTGEHMPLQAISASYSGDQLLLSSVDVFREGTGVATIPAADLIGVEVTHYRTDQDAVVVIPPGASEPSPWSRAALLEDLALNTGLANPGQGGGLGTDPAPSDPGVGLQFLETVFNGPGVDVVIFEVDNQAPDPFVVSPLVFDRPGLTSMTVNSADYVPFEDEVFGLDVYFTDADVTSLDVLETLGFSSHQVFGGYQAYGIALDLSHLGYSLGDGVGGLFLQSVPGASPFDPTYAAGLPFIPEPGTLVLLGGGLAAALRRRRRRA
ncbi:MAG: LamG-like jellyroll fold domain-containing protein [Candidatus Brocadiia bacterium]